MFGGNAVLAYFSVVDLFNRFEFVRIPLSEEIRMEFHRREVQRLDKQRPVASESFFLSWSDAHDELQGFSRKTGKTSKLKIKPQGLFHFQTGADAVVVNLGHTVAGYSSITEPRDELELEDVETVVVISGGRLYLQGPPHHYEFSATIGKWISPTDTEIDEKRALPTDALPLESTPQIAFTHPSQENAERQVEVSTYNAAQQSSLQAARDYRAEASQETPDPKALADLKEKLAAAVTSAFEAQMNLQRVRIKIAQQDLAEVVAKHQRRQSLADKIIERRIEDLISGDGLEWATREKETSAIVSKKTSASRGPIAEAPKKDLATVKELVDDWSKRIRALGDNAMEQHDAALSEIATALQSEDVIQLEAATTALVRLGDVKCDKPVCRPRLLELVRSDDGDIQTMAFHALFTERREGDLNLLQEVLSESHSDLLEYSALQLLLMFGDGVIDSASEDIVLNLLNSSDSTLRRQVLKGLFGLKTNDRLTARVLELIDDNESRDDAIDCVLALSSAKNAAVIDKLIEVLSDSEWKNRDRALNGLRYGVPESQQAKVAAALLQMYESRSDSDTRKRCAELIQIHGDSSQTRHAGWIPEVV